MKKTDLDKKFKLVKDSGDLRKVEKSICERSQFMKENKECDRGDTTRNGVEKICVTEKKLVDVLPKNIEQTASRLKVTDRRAKALTKLEEIKKIRQNYTFRNKNSYAKRGNSECIKENSEDKFASEMKNDRAPRRCNDVVKLSAAPERVSSGKVSSVTETSSKTDKSKTPSKTTLSQQVSRRPLIKTVVSKNDRTKVYKAVNFVEKNATTPLQINIPDLKKETKAKEVVSKFNVKEKRKERKKKEYARPPSSPDVMVKIGSPPTEVAKWANADSHRRLYYEAWVDTTLAAISKKVNDKKYDKHQLLQTFQKALAERPISPELDYKLLLDETYTGKITVNKR